MIPPRSRTAALLLVLAATGLACRTGSAPDEPPARPLVVGIAADFSGPNDLLSSSKLDYEIRSQLFLALLQEQPDYAQHPPTFAPQLAASYEFSDDRLTLTFELRPEVRWSDGTPVTAADVRWTWKAQTSPEVGWLYAFVKESIEDVEVVDRHTVRFHFDHAYPTQLLDANEGFILPRHAWSELPFAQWRGQAGWFFDHLVVDGPFTLERWTPQQELVLAANPGYHRPGRPALAQAVFRVLPEESARLEQLFAGAVDLVEGVPPGRADEVQAHPELRLVEVDGRQYNYLVWNTARPWFADPRVRRALTLAIDRQALVDGLWGGRARVAVSPIPSSVWAHHAGLEPWPYDPGQARELLAAAGWVDHDGDGVRERGKQAFSFELSTNAGNQVRRDALVLIQDQLRQVGVEARLAFYEIQALIGRNERHDFDATLGAWAIDTSLDVSYAFHSREIEGGYNYGAYSNPEADALMDEIAATPDPARAKPAFDRLQQVLHADQPYTFLWEPRGLIAINQRVTDARPNALLTFFELEEWRLAPKRDPGPGPQ